MQAAVQHNVCLIPFGGGTNVVGAVEPDPSETKRMIVTMDMRRMGRLLAVDQVCAHSSAFSRNSPLFMSAGDVRLRCCYGKWRGFSCNICCGSGPSPASASSGIVGLVHPSGTGHFSITFTHTRTQQGRRLSRHVVGCCSVHSQCCGV